MYFSKNVPHLMRRLLWLSTWSESVCKFSAYVEWYYSVPLFELFLNPQICHLMLRWYNPVMEKMK